MSASQRTFDFQSMGQELRGNPKTQIALAGFALVVLYALYTVFGSESPKVRKASTARGGTNLDPRQLQGLRRLPDLAALDKAGELPPGSKVQRDLFMFEAPPPPPDKTKMKPPPPPPPANAGGAGAAAPGPAESSRVCQPPPGSPVPGVLRG